MTGWTADVGPIGGKVLLALGPRHATRGYMVQHQDGSVTGPHAEFLLRATLAATARTARSMGRVA